MTPESERKIWTPFLGKVPTTLALPDYYANYFAYGFDWKRNPHVGLRITGDFGYARYMSYNLYRALKGTSLNALTDVDIEPLPGNVNPFVAGNSADAPNRKYTVNVFCKDNASQETRELKNALTFHTRDDVTLLLVILRYYLPKDRNDTAKVPLPHIEAFDTQHRHPVELPPSIAIAKMPEPLYQERLSPIFQTIVDNTLRFYHVEGSGQFNNADNLYLLNAVRKRDDEVLLLKFKAPSYGLDNSRPPDADVRYWSFNQGNADSSTPTGMPDQEFQKSRDGLTYIAIGDRAIKDWALQGGYNFMRWEADSRQAVVLYRNLVTNPKFPGSIDNVRILSTLQEHPITGIHDPRINGMAAQNYIGPYAPTGIKVTEQEFMTDYGGMPSPGFKGAE
jgi:hypothetical protein